MKYAILRTGGKQYRVCEGQTLQIEKIAKKPKEKIEFKEILLWVDGGERKLGTPFVEGVEVLAEVLGENRSPKIQVRKFKAKARYRKKIGHRQDLTRIRIEKITNVKKESKRESPKIAKKAKPASPKPKA